MEYLGRVNSYDRLITVWIYFLFVYAPCIFCLEYNDIHNLKREILTNYSPDIRPILNQSKAMIVITDFELTSILSFDEQSGIFKTICYLGFVWTDEKLRWNSSIINVESINLHPSLIWKPQIILQNSAVELWNIDTGDGKNENVQIFSNGTVVYAYGGISTTRCDANLYYFPFDKHTCELIIINFESVDHVELILQDLPYRVFEFSNKEWKLLEVKKTQSLLHIFDPFNLLNITIHFQRKPAFYVLNILLPIPCLGFINIFVFGLPISSGERVSFAITILLTCVFFLNTIADRLPPVSEPLSLFNIMVMIVLLNSMLLGICSIFSYMLYEKQNQNRLVPEKVRKWTLYFTQKTNKISNNKTNTLVENIVKSDTENNVPASVEESTTKETVTWQTVSEISDKLFVRFFSILYAVEWVVYLILVINGLLL